MPEDFSNTTKKGEYTPVVAEMDHSKTGHSMESASVTSTATVDGTENDDEHPSPMAAQFSNIFYRLAENHPASDSIDGPSEEPSNIGEEGNTASESVLNSEPPSPLAQRNGQQIHSPTQHSLTDGRSVIRNWMDNAHSEKIPSERIGDQEQSTPANTHGYHYPQNTRPASENGTNSNHGSGNEFSNESPLANSKDDTGLDDEDQQAIQRNPVAADNVLTGPISPALSTTSVDSTSTTFYDCEEIPFLDDDDDINNGDDEQGPPNGNRNFAPANPYWLGKGDHEKAREHMQALLPKQTGNNGPHGPHCKPYRTSPETEYFLSIFGELQTKFCISMLLEDVLMNILIGKDLIAERKAQEALKIAKELNQEPTTARCYYWLGAIEYKRGNEKRAYKYFLEARPCDDEYPAEGKELGMYLGLLQRGLSREDRVLVSLARCGKGTPTKNSNVSELKRKWDDFAEAKQIVCMRAQRQYKTKSGYSKRDPKRADNNSRTVARPKTWVKYDTDDTKPRLSCEKGGTDDNDDHRRSTLKIMQNADLLWLEKVYLNIEDAPKRSSFFEFEKYPKGLAPRTRTAKNFLEQPWEVIIPTEIWSSVKETARNKKVTMSFLRREQQKLNRLSQAKAESRVQDPAVDGTKDHESVLEPISPIGNGEQQPKDLSATSIPLARNEQSDEARLSTAETLENGNTQNRKDDAGSPGNYETDDDHNSNEVVSSMALEMRPM